LKKKNDGTKRIWMTTKIDLCAWVQICNRKKRGKRWRFDGFLVCKI